MSRSFKVNVSMKPGGISRKSFGTILILTDEIETDYKKIKGLEDVDQDTAPKTYEILETMYSQRPQPGSVALLGTVKGQEVDTLKENINESWFVLLTTAQDVETIASVGKYIGTQERFYYATSNVIDDAISLKETLIDNDNVAVGYHETQRLMEGLAVEMSRDSDMGEVSAEGKTIRGINASDLSADDEENLLEANINIYIEDQGVNQTFGAKTIGGEWIDIILSMYYLQARINEKANNVKLRNKKIAYNDSGIKKLVSAVTEGLVLGVNKEIIEPNFVVNYKKANEVDAEEKREREYSHIHAIANPTGAIHYGDINVNLQYEEVEA